MFLDADIGDLIFVIAGFGKCGSLRFIDGPTALLLLIYLFLYFQVFLIFLPSVEKFVMEVPLPLYERQFIYVPQIILGTIVCNLLFGPLVRFRNFVASTKLLNNDRHPDLLMVHDVRDELAHAVLLPLILKPLRRIILTDALLKGVLDELMVPEIFLYFTS